MIEQLLQTGREIDPPPPLVARARLQDYDREYRRSVEDTEGFWGDVAQEPEWFRPREGVFEWTYPTSRWFVAGQCNITHN